MPRSSVWHFSLSQKTGHGQIFVDRFPMNTLTPANEPPIGTLVIRSIP